MRLTEEERAGPRALAASETLRSDMKYLREAGKELFVVDGEVDCVRVAELVTAYNAFLDHPEKHSGRLSKRR